MTHLLSALELEITISYSLKSKLSNARGRSQRASLWDLLRRGICWIKLVVIFFPWKRELSCCQNTEVKISASGNISIRWESTNSAPQKSFIQSHTIAIFFSNRFINLYIKTCELYSKMKKSKLTKKSLWVLRI